MSEAGQNQGLLLHLPRSLREKAQELAQRQGVSLNFFIIDALGERIEKDRRRLAPAQPEDAQTGPVPPARVSSEDLDS